MKKIFLTLLVLSAYFMSVSSSVPDEIYIGEDVFTEEKSVKEQRYVIKGAVTDETGNPLVGATVVIVNTFLGVSTNQQGLFEFKALRGGDYTLKVSFLSYEDHLEQVYLDRDFFLDCQLIPSQIQANDVIVIATRAKGNTPMAYTDIDRETIEKRSTGQDIPYILSAVPSLVETSEAGAGIGYTNFRIRGTDPSRINITIDGIPINDSESQQVFWVNMPDLASSVSSIQVQRGVGTSNNGAAAFGASVNLHTETPSDEPYAEIRSTIGSFNTMIGHFKLGSGLLKEKFKFDLRMSALKSDGYIDYSGSNNQSLFMSGLYNSSIGTFKANVIIGKEVTGISWWGVPAGLLDSARTYNPAGSYTDAFGVPRYYEDQKDNYSQGHLQLFYKKDIGEKIIINAAYHYTIGQGYYEQYKESQPLSNYGLPVWMAGPIIVDNVDVIRRKWMYNHFYGGILNLNYQNDKFELSVGSGINRYVGDHFGRLIWIRYAGWTEKEYQWYLNGSSKNEINMHSKINYNLSNKINIFGDMQFRYIKYVMDGVDDDLLDLNIDKQYNFFNPKAGIFYKIDQDQQLFLSIAIANREPGRANFKDAKGDPAAEPLPETLYDFESGYSLKGKIFSAGLNAYYMFYTDQLVPTGKLSNVGYPIMTNVQRSYRAGLEFSAAVKPMPSLEWNGNLGLSHNRIKDFVESYSDYNTTSFEEISKTKSLGDVNIAYSPSVVLNSDFSYNPIKNMSIHFISKYVGKQYFDNTNSEDRTIDPYFVNNLRMEYEFSLKDIEAVNLQLLVNNIFNTVYENNAYGGNWYVDGEEFTWANYFPQAGINYLLKLTLRF